MARRCSIAACCGRRPATAKASPAEPKCADCLSPPLPRIATTASAFDGAPVLVPLGNEFRHMFFDMRGEFSEFDLAVVGGVALVQGLHPRVGGDAVAVIAFARIFARRRRRGQHRALGPLMQAPDRRPRGWRSYFSCQRNVLVPGPPASSICNSIAAGVSAGTANWRTPLR
jgi:hypothetical protein